MEGNYFVELIPQLRDNPPKSCGADRDRTCDPRVANAMLSQLSYSPKIGNTLE